MANIAAAALTGMAAEFTFEAGPYTSGEFSVLSFEAEEELSRPFTLEVTLVAQQDEEIDTAALIGEMAVLTIHHDAGAARFVNGIVSRVKRWEAGTGPYRKRFRIWMVPTLSKLKRIKRSRIFQQQTAPEIVQQVLNDAGIELRVSLSGTYTRRDYCVQYRETDFNFVSRLLEEEGIFYWFEHEDSKHTLVLGDATSAYGAIRGQSRIPYKEEREMVSGSDYVDQFSASLELRPGKMALRDYNPLHPAVDMSAAQTASNGDAALEVYDYPGIYADADAGRAVAKIRLEEARVQAALCGGAGVSRRLVPGCVFELDEYPIPELNDAYLVLKVEHRGEQPEVIGAEQSEGQEVYRCRFTCLQKEIPFRPERRAEIPHVPGAQTALVVGPAGEEIHTDQYGRIKVQFHWDREGKRDENSSCWIRVSQSWAGSGWGALYLPRIGQEVVVEFLEGNPDRPLVTGSVYNGQNPVPLDLPSEKTRSTLRSASSPGSNGSNELRFEDATGLEEIYLHAQKDWNIVIENDKSQTVGGNEALSVAKNRQRDIGGNQSLTVGKDDSSVIEGNQVLQVTKDRTTVVGGNHTERIEGEQGISVGGDLSVNVARTAVESIAVAKALNVGAAYAVTVGAAMNELVVGLKSEEVGGAKAETIGGMKTERVGGSRSLTVGGSMSEHVAKSKTLKVGGNLTQSVTGKASSNVAQAYKLKAKEITLAADEVFTIQTGSATLQIKKNGDIVMKGTKIEMTATGDIVVKGSKIKEN